MFHSARSLTRGALVATLAVGISATATPAEAATNSAPGWTVIAHRGGLAGTPEHTMAAFKHMIDIGVNGVEFDIQMTGDNVPMVFHDDTLDRTTNCTGAIARRTFRSLAGCDAGNARHPNQAIPTVSGALKYIKSRTGSNFLVFLHVKPTSTKAAKRIAGVVKSTGMGSRVVVIGDSASRLKKLKKAGLKRQGLVFNDPAGFSSPYKYLIPFNVSLNSTVIRKAHQRGQYVLPVEKKPYSLIDLAFFDIDGVLANHIDNAMQQTGRWAPPPPPAPSAPPATTPGPGTDAGTGPGETGTGTGDTGTGSGTGGGTGGDDAGGAEPETDPQSVQTAGAKKKGPDTHAPIRTTGPMDF